jgi:uncharacterized membrane protein YozB (DUF420 family)
MYEFILGVHNILRWVTLILGFLAVLRAFIGWFGKHAWIPADPKIGRFFTSAIDIQLLVGLLLYIFFSPFTLQAIRNFGFGTIMEQVDYRFFAVEHLFYMLLAVVFAHLGSALPKKVDRPVDKHRRAAIWFGLALLLILIGMPWFRPLLPGLG